MSKYLDPLWQTNPVLAQVREALKEVEHIRRALLVLEANATKYVSPAGAKDLEQFLLLAASSDELKDLDGWCKSLAESEIGLHAMMRSSSRKRKFQTGAFVERRKRFLDEQLMKWAIIMMGKGVVRIGSKVANFLDPDI